MSNWQSFFNQLAKPVNTASISSTTQICRCEKGTLVFSKNLDVTDAYIPQDSCSLSAVCCAIQVDKHRSRTFSRSPLTVQREEKLEVSVVEKQASRIVTLEDFIGR